MSDVSQGPGWWQASDLKWYPPNLTPGQPAPAPTPRDALPGQQAPDLLIGGPARTQPGISRIRSIRKYFPVGAVIVIAAIAVVASLEIWGGSNSNDLAGKSAAQVLSLAESAARSEGAVTASESGGGDGTNVYKVNSTEGKQYMSYEQQTATLLVLPHMAYLNASEQFLQEQLGTSIESSELYAGRWLYFSPSYQGYQEIVYADTLSSLLSSSMPTGHLALAGLREIDGRQVEGVKGGLDESSSSGFPQGTTGSVTVYVSTISPHLPVEAIQTATYKGHSERAVITFSGWGESITLTAPKGAVALNTVSNS